MLLSAFTRRAVRTQGPEHRARLLPRGLPARAAGRASRRPPRSPPRHAAPLRRRSAHGSGRPCARAADRGAPPPAALLAHARVRAAARSTSSTLVALFASGYRRPSPSSRQTSPRSAKNACTGSAPLAEGPRPSSGRLSRVRLFAAAAGRPRAAARPTPRPRTPRCGSAAASTCAFEKLHRPLPVARMERPTRSSASHTATSTPSAPASAPTRTPRARSASAAATAAASPAAPPPMIISFFMPP